MKELWKIFLRNWRVWWKTFFLWCYLPSAVCYVVIEVCSRKSLLDTGLFLLKDPLVFLFNILIIAAMASVCLLVQRRIFALSVILLLWTAVGVTDAVLLSFRTTPFTAVDLVLIKDAFTIAHRYLSWGGVALILTGIVLAVLLVAVLFRRAPKVNRPVGWKAGIVFSSFLIVLCFFLADFGRATGLLDHNFGNLAQAFHDNGLPYCFMNSVLNTGVEKPEDYSEEAMADFLDKFEKEEGRELITEFPTPSVSETEAVLTPSENKPSGNTASETPAPSEALEDETKENTGTEEIEGTIKENEDDCPNIIFLQLESFFDVKYMENFSCTENPVPFFTSLRENYPSGFLSVPSIGAGTANTEFECLTGMNLDLFGPGEYPYKTVLKNTTCESMAYLLKKRGLSATAIHNNDGTFYGRNEVFSNLGFDRFISLEYMTRVEKNELGWAKDRILVGQIMKVLSGTKEHDFIYAISVQGHGAYPEEPLLTETKLDIRLPEELEDYYYQYLYYVHQLNEMDSFLKELVLNLSACQEDIVLVLYGDHLPSLGLSDELLKNKNAFQTEYVIWSNFSLEAEDEDMEAYQLSSHVFELLDIEEGIMPQYHAYRHDSEDYLENQQLLMYDMLYGEQEIFNGVNPYEPTELEMGIEKIHIQDVYIKTSLIGEEEPLLYVSGQNFTEWSKIVINEKEVETIFLNERLLAATELPKSENGRYEIIVRQQGDDEIVLSETEAVEYWLEDF